MRKTVAGLVLILVFAGTAPAGDLDPDTLAGMDAEVAGDWAGAVRAFRRAAEADPGDARRAARLTAARERGLRFWTGSAERLLERELPRPAAACVAAALRIAPDDPGVAKLRKRLKEAGHDPAAVPPAKPPHPAFPLRCRLGRIRATLRMGEVHEEAERIVEGALGWLVAMQEPDGLWSTERLGGFPPYAPGVTGLALLALLTDGPSALEGTRGEAVRRAAALLQKSARDDGLLITARSDHFPYSHAIATEALATYALLSKRTAERSPRLTAAVGFIERLRTPGAGWRYGFEPGDSDTSVTYWMTSALHTAELAGVDVKPDTWRGAAAWVEKMTDPDTGITGYVQRGSVCARPPEFLESFPADRTASLTAAGFLVRRLAGHRDPDIERKQIREVLRVRPNARVPDMYYWHAGARALVAARGTVPPKWYGALVRAAARHRDGSGAIRPSGPWGKDGGPVYSTAITVLALRAPTAEVSGGASGGAASDFLAKGRRTVHVPADSTGTPTGVYVGPGLFVRVDPSGEVRDSPRGEIVGPAGHKVLPEGRERLTRKGGFGCLLGRVGLEGELFAIKRRIKVRPRKECGQLHLLRNGRDLSGSEGELTVEIVSLRKRRD